MKLYTLLDIFDPLEKKKGAIREKDIRYRKRVYLPVIFVIFFFIYQSIDGFNSRMITGLGMLINILASLLLMNYTDSFFKNFARIASTTSEEKGFMIIFLERKAKLRTEYALFYLLLGFVLQFIGLILDS